MGTSTSLTGAGPGSPLVPSWVEDVPGDTELPEGEQLDESPPTDSPPAPTPLVKERRLSSARRDLGSYALDGNQSRLRRGVANYVRHGRGGAAMAARRSAGVAGRAGTLAGIVGGSAAFDDVRDQIRHAVANSGDPTEILAAIATATSPNDGTIDSETGQRAASQALQYVLELYPDADPLALQPLQRELLLERYLAIDCFEFFYTEVGKHIQAKIDLALYATRIREIKEYFCETFRQANRTRRESGMSSLGASSDRSITTICHAVIAEAYTVFEAYLDAS